MELKTNVLRILDKNKTKYISHLYESNGAISGKEVAESIGKPCSLVYKTLVTVGKSKKNYVFVIPVCSELDLKKAAAAAGEKSIHMIPQKELFPLTGLFPNRDEKTISYVFTYYRKRATEYYVQRR